MKNLILLIPILLFSTATFAQKPPKPTIEERTAALKAMLLSKEFKATFRKDKVIYILKNEQTCAQIDCQHFL